jgi:hypothetical protein
MPSRFLVSERQTVLVTAVIEADTEEEAERIFLDGDPPGIDTKVIDSGDLTVEELEDEETGDAR